MTDCCCWFWEPNTPPNITNDMLVISDDGSCSFHNKRFVIEYIRMNYNTFYIKRKSLDGKVQIILKFYDSIENPKFVNGVFYINGREYRINTYNNNTFSLYN